MTVILVILTFAIFLTIDYFRNRKPAEQPVPALAFKPSTELSRTMPPLVAGFQLPAVLRYHPGHTWALGESPTLVRVGMDDFAARFVGKVESIELPKQGQWIRQGQKIMTVFEDGKRASLVSPIEGEVAGVNQAIVKDPALATRDPYGEGWLLTVHSPDAKTSFRNLLGGSLARRWMEDAASRLMIRLPALAGAVAQDGGVAVADTSTHLSEESWNELAHEFFLT
ncbi:MAG TPA: glycine cleavage system protein H [Terriglobia bacterium]|nr:glycine cleavage system protein H [Terriglobia bacterium]